MSTLYPISHLSTDMMLHGFDLQIQKNAHIVDLAGGISSLYEQGSHYVSIDPVYKEGKYTLTNTVQQNIASLFLSHWYEYPEYIIQGSDSKLKELASVLVRHPLIIQYPKEDIKRKIKNLKDNINNTLGAITHKNKFQIAQNFLYGNAHGLLDKQILYTYTPDRLIDILVLQPILSSDARDKIQSLAEVNSMAPEELEERILRCRNKQIEFYTYIQELLLQENHTDNKQWYFLPKTIEDMTTGDVPETIDYIFCNFLFNNASLKTTINILKKLETIVQDSYIYIATNYREEKIVCQVIKNNGAYEKDNVLYRKCGYKDLVTVRKEIENGGYKNKFSN